MMKFVDNKSCFSSSDQCINVNITNDHTGDTDVINQNGRKTWRFKRFCCINTHISAWIYRKDITVWNSAQMTSAHASDDVNHANFQTVISLFTKHQHLPNLYCGQNVKNYYHAKIPGWSRHVFLSKSTRFESTDFAPVTIDHQCPCLNDSASR